MFQSVRDIISEWRWALKDMAGCVCMCTLHDNVYALVRIWCVYTNHHRYSTVACFGGCCYCYCINIRCFCGRFEMVVVSLLFHIVMMSVTFFAFNASILVCKATTRFCSFVPNNSIRLLFQEHANVFEYMFCASINMEIHYSWDCRNFTTNSREMCIKIEK